MPIGWNIRLDGLDWKTYGGHSDLQVRSPHVDEKQVKARYLKVTITNGTRGLWEFKVY